MRNTQRKIFLSDDWIAYSAMPSEYSVFGRIADLRGNTLTVNGLQYEAGPAVLVKPTKRLTEIAGSELKSLLQPGDLICLKKSGTSVTEIFLLAASLSEPQNLLSKKETLINWQAFLLAVRTYFTKNGFLEVSTPTLTICPGTEPFLDLFETKFVMGRQEKTFFLPTSPELHLKKALAGGYNNIFEIRTCFRNGEISLKHQPEFWMLEWYRSYAGLEKIKNDLRQLVTELSAYSYCADEFVNLTMAELFKEFLGFSLNPETSFRELKNLAEKKGLAVEKYTDWDDLFYLLFVEFIEPQLGKYPLLFVEKYPPTQAALARLTEDGWGDRFEFYFNGIEIANAFHELNDPIVQRLRFNEDLDRKSILGKRVPPIDEDFLKALESGMPPSAGIALGLERLFMALNGISDIEDLRLFPNS